ncbi:MAG: DUF3592 domain-containing protein [Cyclobacteriaceae bacterium]|nr:DUF3592 domain-containing protein [Cyclobacteriaceae bacterium]
MNNVSEKVRKEVEERIVMHGKIAAIKFLRSMYGMDLRTAKQAVELVEKEMDPLEYDHLKKPAKPLALVPLIFAVVGLVMLVICYFVHISNQRIIEEGVLHEGRVIKLVSSSNKANQKAPVIEYTWQSQTFQYKSNTYSSPPAYTIGERVELYVLPEDPNKILINDFSNRWLLITILGSLGLVFTFIGMGTAIKMWIQI